MHPAQNRRQIPFVNGYKLMNNLHPKYTLLPGGILFLVLAMALSYHPGESPPQCPAEGLAHQAVQAWNAGEPAAARMYAAAQVMNGTFSGDALQILRGPEESSTAILPAIGSVTLLQIWISGLLVWFLPGTFLLILPLLLCSVWKKEKEPAILSISRRTVRYVLVPMLIVQLLIAARLHHQPLYGNAQAIPLAVVPGGEGQILHTIEAGSFSTSSNGSADWKLVETGTVQGWVHNDRLLPISALAEYCK